ncbi:hypothetical protein JCM5350_008068 [Sporobolomyces pararoseus]
MPAILPSVGTVYPSLAEFKLDIFERGFGPQAKFCNFRIVARESRGVVRVTTSDENHTCGSEVRQADEEAARTIMQGKVNALKAEIGGTTHQGSSRHAVVSKKRNRKNEEAEEEEYEEESTSDDEYVSKAGDDDSENEEREVVAAKIARKGKSVKRQRSSAQLKFPAANLLSQEIKALKRKGLIFLPSRNQPFDTARELLIVLYSYAQQNGFSIYRWSGPEATSNLLMVCSRRHSRYRDAPGGTCKVELTAEEDAQTGNWRLTSMTGAHNHENIVDQTQNRSLSALQQPSTSKSLVDSSSRVLSQVQLPSFSSSQISPPFQSISRLTDHQSLSTTYPPQQLIPIRHPSDLVSFLRSFSSSPSILDHTLSTLSLAGIDSLELLISILSMSEGALQNFTSFIEATVGDELQAMAKELRDDQGKTTRRDTL